jgi:hypothetical protein
VEPVLELVKAAAREVALGDELVAAVLAAGFDDVVLASLLLEEDAVVVPEMLAEVDLGEGEMLVDENGALVIMSKVGSGDRLLLVLELNEEEVLVVELSTNDGEILLDENGALVIVLKVGSGDTLLLMLELNEEEVLVVELSTNDGDRLLLVLELDEEEVLVVEPSTNDGGILLEVEEAETLVKLTTIAKGAVLMLEEVSVLESVIRATFEEDETVLVVSSVPELEKVPDARLEVTVGSTAAELFAKEPANAMDGAGVKRKVVVGTVVARAESLAANVVVLFSNAEITVPVVSWVVFVAKDILGSGGVVLVLEADMVVIFELVARLALPPKPEVDEYEMLDRAEVMDESSEMVEVPMLLALLELVAVVDVILSTYILFKSNFAGALRLSCVDSTQMEDEVGDMAAFVAIGIATATVECRTLHPGDKPVPILVEVSSVTAIHFQDNQKTE